MGFGGEGDDVWEQKTQARYGESELSRRLLPVAVDPDSSASDLGAVAQGAVTQLDKQLSVPDPCLRVADVLASHPNTPPEWFGELISRSPLAGRAFCQNPVAPLLLLESPDLVARWNETAQNALLREADAPLAMVHILSMAAGAARSKVVQRAARLHIGLAGEAHSRDEWEAQARDAYRALCRETNDAGARNWHADLAEIGLVPEWADGGRSFEEPSLPELTKFHASPHPFVEQWLRFEHEPGSQQEAHLMYGLFLRSVGCELEDERAAAWALRKETAPDELRRVFRGPAGASEAIKEVVLRHPSTTPSLIAEAMEEGTDARLIVSLPQTPPNVLADILRYHDPLMRRLARRHLNAPTNACEIARRNFGYIAAERRIDIRYPLVSLAACLYGEPPQEDLSEKAEHSLWTQRFEAALLAPVSHVRLPGYAETRTGRDLLDHLTRDGNRIVRAAARTRLAAPTYRFTL